MNTLGTLVLTPFVGSWLTFFTLLFFGLLLAVPGAIAMFIVWLVRGRTA